ncbi:MAG TPA: hypothetical protein VKA49_10865 [Flavitalea sp.]|nr:hypothetical protein [Flavitalea sp.]
MKKLPGLFVTMSILIMSCQRELSYSTEEAGENKSVGDFHAKNRKDQQLFTINAANSNIVSASKGTKLHLPSNGFITQDGRPVSGSIQVSIKEIYTPMEMILNNMPTSSNGRLLESGGEFQITATQNKDTLISAPGTFIKITIPDIGKNMQGMQVFNGVANTASNMDWVPNTNPGNVVVGDSTLFSNTNLFCDDINWINCDKFINEPTVEFTVYPGNAASGDSTNVFVHLTGRNTVVKMNWTQGLSYFKSDKLLAVPSTIVGISTKNGQLFASIGAANIQNGASTTMNFMPYTEKELKARLSQLR